MQEPDEVRALDREVVANLTDTQLTDLVRDMIVTESLAVYAISQRLAALDEMRRRVAAGMRLG